MRVFNQLVDFKFVRNKLIYLILLLNTYLLNYEFALKTIKFIHEYHKSNKYF